MVELFNSLIILLLITTNVNLIELENVNKLTDYFFANLEGAPDFNEEFINKQVQNYLSLIDQFYFVHGAEKNQRKPRSVDGNNKKLEFQEQIYIPILNDFIPFARIPVYSPKEIIFFQQNFNKTLQWYAAAIETLNEIDLLIFYKYSENNFLQINSTKINGGVKIASYVMETLTFIVVAEQFEHELNNNKFENKVKIFQFTTGEELYEFQTLNVGFASDAIFWKINQELYLSVAQEKLLTSSGEIFETVSPVYKWQKNLFDIVCNVKTSGAKRITHFTVDNTHYLAFANYQNNEGDTKIYSEIFKFNHNTDTYEIHQKLLTIGAVDVKYFCFKYGYKKEHFLVFANYFDSHKDELRQFENDVIFYKFVDGYFLPIQSFELVGVNEILPVMGPNSEFILLVSTKFNGIKIYQYNGWKFFQSSVQYFNGAFNIGVLSMNFYNFNNTPTIAIANENDHSNQMINIFQPNFTYENKKVKQYEEMYNWCLTKLKEVNLKSVNQEETTQKNETDLINEQILFLENESSNGPPKITSRASHFGDKIVTTTPILQKLTEIEKSLSEYTEELEKLNSTLDNYYHEKNINTLRSIIAKTIVLNNDTNLIKDLIASTINDENVVNLLKDVVHSEEGIVFDTIFLNNVTVLNNFNPKLINGRKVEDLVYNNESLKFLPDLIINGNVTFNSSLEITKTYNNNSLDFGKILLNNVNQSFNNSLNISHVNSDLITAKLLNKLSLNSPDLIENNDSMNFTNLIVENLVVNGSLNHVKIDELLENSLKIEDNRNVNSTYHFDKLYVNNIIVKQNLSGKKVPEDFLNVNQGVYKVSDDIIFDGALTVKDLYISKMLNNIRITSNGDLPVLSKKTSDLQYITGKKIFDKVELLNPFRLRGKINSNQLEKRNPVAMVDETVIVKGNIEILGNVNVEKLMRANDVKTTTGRHSLKLVRDLGLPLNEREIPVHLKFDQQLTVEALTVDKINNFDCKNWVYSSINNNDWLHNSSLENINGLKTFSSDLHITGNVKIHIINGINTEELQSKALKLNGDQKIPGRLTFENVKINNRGFFDAQFVNIAGNDWSDVLLIDRNQDVKAMSNFLADVKSKNLVVKNVRVEGDVNGVNVKKLLNSIETGDKKLLNEDKIEDKNNLKSILDSLEETNTLNIKNYKSKEASQLLQFLSKFQQINSTFQINEDITFPSNIAIENISYRKFFNNVSSEVHEKISRSRGDVPEDIFFDKISVYGHVTVKSNNINGINIYDFYENSVKINKPHKFRSALFETEIISPEFITLDGHVENIDINNIISSRNIEQELADEKIFAEDFIVEGNLIFNGLVNGVNITALCGDLNPIGDGDDLKNLVVEGNVDFIGDFDVNRVNNYNLDNLLSGAWFGNSSSEFAGLVKFNEVIFEDDVYVQGLIDGVNLAWLAQNVFTLNTNQSVTAGLNFAKRINFLEGLKANELEIHGDINKIVLEEFVAYALLDNMDQTFESVFYSDRCEIKDIQGKYLINGYDVARDLMRYDSDNIMIGKVNIKNLKTDKLLLDRSYKVQNVDLKDWIKNAVGTKGLFALNGTTLFKSNVTFHQGLGTLGLINELPFDEKHIMLKSTNQKITGRKSFNPSGKNTSFKDITLNGTLNGVNLQEFLSKQAYKNQDINYDIPVNFNSTLIAENVNFNQKFNNVNVWNILSDLNRNKVVKTFNKHYDNLYGKAVKVMESIEAQANFFHYYKEIQVFENYYKLLPIKIGSKDRLAAVFIENDLFQTDFHIDFYQWDNKLELFVRDTEISSIVIGAKIRHINSLIFVNETILFIETDENVETKENAALVMSLLELNDDPINSFNITQKIQSSGSVETHAFMLQNMRKCFAVIQEIDFNIYVYCQINEKFFGFLQNMTNTKANEITSTNIGDTTYLFALNFDDDFSLNVAIWKYSQRISRFLIIKRLFFNDLSSVAVVSLKKNTFLAMSSGNMEGAVQIKRFSQDLNSFTDYQMITTVKPIKVKFSVLPSNELLLHILNKKSQEILSTYLYDEFSGFTKKSSFIIGHANNFQEITIENEHFVMLENSDGKKNQINILKGVFK